MEPPRSVPIAAAPEHRRCIFPARLNLSQGDTPAGMTSLPPCLGRRNTRRLFMTEADDLGNAARCDYPDAKEEAADPDSNRALDATSNVRGRASINSRSAVLLVWSVLHRGTAGT